MTKKYYEITAKRIKAEREYHKMMQETEDITVMGHSQSCIIAIESLTYSLIQDFLDDNPHFDVDKFMLACGM